MNNWRAKRKVKRFLKLIGAEDAQVVNPEAQMFWASICARAAFKSFTTDYMVVPVAIEDKWMPNVTKQEWLPLMHPASHVGFYPNDDETFKLCFDRTDPSELISDPGTQQVLGRAFDLLETCEDDVWSLPQSVNAAAHKLRTAINRNAQASLGGSD